MKNQYFGDVNDYRKYGLLRSLQAIGNDSLLVAWMLTPPDGGRDGGFRGYLDSPATWRKYDPELFRGLTRLLRSGRQPAISLIEGAGLLPRASFHAAVVPDKGQERKTWRGQLLRAASGVDLVFVDPDNGIEVPSKPVGHKGSSKYVTWDEIDALWSLGCSVLIYQHFRREKRDGFAARMASELQCRTGTRHVEAFRTAHVLFLLAVQDRHSRRFEKALALISNRWHGQINAMGLFNGTAMVYGSSPRNAASVAERMSKQK